MEPKFHTEYISNPSKFDNDFHLNISKTVFLLESTFTAETSNAPQLLPMTNATRFA